ncbi:MAG: hypothetical protein K2Q12_05530 [Rickettsiales bacterium]|nr:hypothetical protein [Rickettsiales bacterium]
MNRHCAFATFWLVALTALPVVAVDESSDAVRSGEIKILEKESSVAASQGILSSQGKPDSFSWAGSDPQVLKTLLAEFTHPLSWQAQREVAVATLSSPVLPDADGDVPENWLLLRMEALYRLSEYEGGWTLFRSLNPSFLTEPVARLGATIGWATGRTHRTCDLTGALMKNESTEFESESSRLYWLIHYMLCQQLDGKQAEAEISLGLLQESVPKQLPPLLAPLFEGGDATLPTLSAKDAILYSALAALIDKNTNGIKQRIGSDFVSIPLAQTLPPELQASLSGVSKLPVLLRAYFAERALQAHRLDANQLAALYLKVARLSKSPKDTTLLPTYTRALTYVDTNTSRTAENQVQTVESALRTFHKIFSARDSRAILGKTLRKLVAEDHGLSITLLYETIGLYLDRGDNAEAEDVARALNNHQDNGSEIAASIAGRILQIAANQYRFTNDEIVLPDFAQAPDASIVWLVTRYGRIMEAQGYRVRWPERPLDGLAPPPDLNYAAPERLNALHMSLSDGSHAEQLLRSLQVLDATPPQRTSDQALLQVLAAWNKVGLRSYSNALMTEALLGIPDRRVP